MQKRSKRSIFFLSLVLMAVFCFAGYGFAEQEAPDGVLAAPPPLAIQGTPDVVVVPSQQYPNQYVYMVPNMEGVYVYQGVWYRHHAGFWWSAPVYNGVWTPTAVVPPVIISVPFTYSLFLPDGYHRIHYGEFHEHWHSWEGNRHWHHQSFYQHEMRAEVRRERMERIERHNAEKHLERVREHTERVNAKIDKENAREMKKAKAEIQRNSEPKKNAVASEQKAVATKQNAVANKQGAVAAEQNAVANKQAGVAAKQGAVATKQATTTKAPAVVTKQKATDSKAPAGQVKASTQPQAPKTVTKPTAKPQPEVKKPAGDKNDDKKK